MNEKPINRREFLRLAGLSSGAAILAACTTQATETEAPAEEEPPAEEEQPEPTSPPAEQERIVVEFLGWPGDTTTPLEKDKYEEEYPQYELKFVEQQEGVQLLTLVAAGTPPDASRVESNVYRSFAKDNTFVDITPYIEADELLGQPDYFIQPQESERCVYEGKWYGIGSCWVAPHVYYNADLFAEEGIEPPSNDPEKAWTWDKFLEVGRQLTIDKSGKHPGEDGFDYDNVERFGINWPQWWIPLHAAIQSNEGAWIDTQSQLIVLDTPDATDALQAVADLVLVHQVMPQSTFFEALGMSDTQFLENKKVGMSIDGSWALMWLSEMQGKLGTAALPKMKRPATDLQAHLHCVVTGTDTPDGAWTTVRFLSEPWFQEQYLQKGLWLPSQTALMTPEAIARWCTPPIHPEDYSLIVTQYVPKYGHFLTMPVGYPKANDTVIQPALDSIWTGDQTAADAMKVVPEANDVMLAEQQRGS